MIFISTSWSPSMTVSDHCIIDYRKITKADFDKYKQVAISCINKPQLAKVLHLAYNPEHIQLRPGDALLVAHIKGGKISPYDDELPEDVIVEYYCYNVYSPETHVINEKELIKMEE